MSSDTDLFVKLFRKTTEVLDPTDPKKKVFQDVVDKLDEIEEIDRNGTDLQDVRRKVDNA